MFYKYTIDITYTTKSGRGKNKQEWTWVNPMCKKGEILAFFWHSVAIAGMYPNKIPTQLPGTLTHPFVLADMASGFTGPNSSSLQSPLSDHCLFLTVTNSYLLTALEPCLFSSSSGLVGNLVRKPFVWVSHQNRQRNPVTGAHPHPRPSG